MIHSYQDFLSESAIALICESQVHYSPRLRGFLKGIDSPVAAALLEIELQDLDVASNYLDLSDNKEQVSFIPDKKARELKAEDRAEFAGGQALTHNMAENGPIFGLLGYEPTAGGHNTPDPGQAVTVISRAESPTSGRVYAMVEWPGPAGHLRSVVRDEYLRPAADYYTRHRQTVRTGRLVRAMLSAAGRKFSDRELDDFVNKFRSEFDQIGDVFSRFRLIKGGEIGTIYHSRNYLHGKEKGTIGNSCMCMAPESFFEIYSSNPSKCALLVLRAQEDPAKITARAIVWTLDSPTAKGGGPITFMDRVYYTEDAELQLFRDYARKQGWHAKSLNNSSDSAEAIAPDGGLVDLRRVEVRIAAEGYENYPYVDTLKYLTTGSSHWTLTNDPAGAGYTLDDTGGDRNSTECERCGGDGRVDCGVCDGDGWVECERCDGTGHEDCYRCSGEGSLDGETCPDCEGSGSADCQARGCHNGGRVNCGNCGGDRWVDCPDCR